MMQISPYLMFDGNAEEAMKFYERTLGAKTLMVQRFDEAPMPSDEASKNKIMHASLQIGEAPLMISDGGDKQKIEGGNNVHLSLNFFGEAEINKAFEALSESGQITMPLQDTFWGARFGMLTDKFGINWMFNWDRPGVKPDQN